MSRAWGEQERERVRDALVREGQRLFEQYGLQKTTIDEIVAAAGISKGSFYLFFRSKEELYFEIVRRVESEFKEALYADLESPNRSHRESFRLFLNRSVDALVSKPIYRQIRTLDLESLMRSLPPELLAEHMKSDGELFADHFEGWIREGWMRAVSMEALNGVFLSLLYFIVHRDEIGAPSFEASKELLLDMITEYLIPADARVREVP